MFKIALVGNPNTGKTTLYNTLTKSNEKASNWHGVTVDIKNKSYKYKELQFIVYDTPGIYLLDGAVAEESITKNWLKSSACDLVVNICDANNFKRNFALTQELINFGLNIIVAVNMSKEVCLYDYSRLSNEHNIKIIEIDARKAKSVNLLKSAIYDNLTNKKPQKPVKSNKIHINIDNYLIKQCKNDPYYINDRIDKLILNKAVFCILFALLLLFIFYTTFNGVGLLLSNIINSYFNKTIDKLRKIILCVNINKILISIIFDAVLSSFVAICSFLPQILLLMFFINLLEDIGFMSRIAFMFDGFLKKIGLSGKSLFSIFMGYGCTTSAVVTSRNLQDTDIRKRTILLLPYSSCSAKLPIFLLISSLFFERLKFLFVFGLYVLSILIQLIYALLLNKFQKINNPICLFEMPKYRLPNLKKVCLDSLRSFKDFTIKTGGLLLVFSTLVWLLKNFSFRFEFLGNGNFTSSILYKTASVVSPLFKPIGLNNPAIIVAIFFGLIAKEFLIVGLAMMNAVFDVSLLASSLVNPISVCYFTPVSSVVFLIFILLYSPCFSCISSIASEVGFKTAIFVFISQFVVAYICAFVVRCLLLNFTVFIFLLVVIVLAFILLTMLKSNCNNNCKGKCDACRNT